MSPLKGGLCLVQRQLLLLYSPLLLLMSYISAYYFFIDSNTIDKIASLTSGKIKDAFSMSSFTGKAEADDNHLLK
ncbi:hypothetical protein AKH06_14880 [Vibrio parahaemolyticus]|nr:hypothetical protein AKH06_14880 [Vibrio parahaemolyticus]OCP45674.1 hypothetical protein AKH02_09560 [Vibrio parahaemolyticus]